MTSAQPKSEGGYDSGYSHCPCFWGTEPGTLVRALESEISDFGGLRVLDAGCGEAKNAAHLAARGANVLAFDVSPLAISNGRIAFGSHSRLDLSVADVRTEPLEDGVYDVVIAYGLLHCLQNRSEIDAVVAKLQGSTAIGGYNLLCAFNDRITDLAAHPGFNPTFVPHAAYCDHYAGGR